MFFFPFTFPFTPVKAETNTLQHEASGASSGYETVGNENPLESILEPKVERRVIKEPNIDSENFELGISSGIITIEDFGSSIVYEVFGAYHATEDLFLQINYGISEGEETSFERLNATLLSDDERNFTYYNVSVGYNVLPGEAFITDRFAFNHALYFIAGVGNTDFGGKDHFAITAGIGYRLILMDWFAVHFEASDQLFDSDVIAGEKTVHNLMLQTGFSFFF